MSNLLRLMSWLTPAMPTGAFAYSHGLEAAVAERRVTDEPTLRLWLLDMLRLGAPVNDARLMAAAMQGVDADELVDLARALSGSAERLEESEAQGAAFAAAAGAWTDEASAPRPLPVAVGLAARTADLDPEAALAAFLHGFVANQVQCALRLMPLGQQAGLRVLAALERPIAEAAAGAAAGSLDDLGTAAIGAEIAALRHETLPARLFRS